MSTVDEQHVTLRPRYSGLIPVGSLLLACLIGLVVSQQVPDLGKHLACSRESVLSMRLHTLIAYAFWPLSAGHLLSIAVSLLLSVYFISDFVAQRSIWMVVLGSIALGAVLFSVLVHPPAMLVSAVMVSWGLGGVVLALGFTTWRHLGVLRRIYLILVWVFTVALMFSFSAVGYVQLLVAVAAFAYVCFLHRAAVLKTDAARPNQTLQPTRPSLDVSYDP